MFPINLSATESSETTHRASMKTNVNSMKQIVRTHGMEWRTKTISDSWPVNRATIQRLPTLRARRDRTHRKDSDLPVVPLLSATR